MTTSCSCDTSSQGYITSWHSDCCVQSLRYLILTCSFSHVTSVPDYFLRLVLRLAASEYCTPNTSSKAARAFDLGFLTNGFLQANDTMQGHDALLHVISLVDWPKHVKFFFTDD